MISDNSYERIVVFTHMSGRSYFIERDNGSAIDEGTFGVLEVMDLSLEHNKHAPCITSALLTAIAVDIRKVNGCVTIQ